MNCIDKLIHRLLLMMLIAGWSILKVHASEQIGFSFPSARPEQVGMNQARLEQAKLYSLSAGGSGMIVRHGQVVLRWADQKKRYDIKSATKSFGATMLGIAIMDGKIELDAHAKRYHPNLGVHPQSNVETEWLDDITIRHLATQTAGFEKPGGYEKLLFKPGTHWHYSDGGPNWLAECITLQYRRDLEDLMFERVFTPLGITRDDLRWRKNQYREHEIEGIARREFGAGIHANVEALARLGYLYLHNGRWKDQQILAQDFVEMVRRPVESVVGLPEWSDSHGNASDHYSLLWWNNADGALAKVPRDAYWAWGLYDSLIVVIPSLDLVVVRGGERGRRLPRADGANHYYVLRPLLEPIAAAVDTHAGGENRFSFLMVKPGQVGMDGAKLEKAREYALTGGGSGCIIRGGRLVMAWGDQKQKYDIYSSTKSISVTALGLAIMDGKVNLHDKAKKYLPTVGTPPEGNARTGWLDELTLWHLATQTGGFEKTRGWCRQTNRPGTTWMYSDGGPNWLADCLTVAYGRDVLDVMNERVFEPLDITVGETPRGGEYDLHWGFNNLDRPQQVSGINRRPFGAGIHCNVQAMAKVGYLYLQRGHWRGKQIIPESFVGLATNQAEGIDKLPVKDGLLWSAGASQHYGLLWWNNSDGAIDGVPRDAYWSWGLKESFIIVIPSLDIVAVRAGDYWAPRNDPKRKDSFNNILKPFLVPICESVAHRGPYPPSARIPRVTFSDLILDKHINGPDYASGDQWAGTWADDGHLYMGWGDGTGFGHRGGWRDPSTAFMGLALLEGTPPNHRGVNLWGGYKPQSQAGALYVNRDPQPTNLKPADGLISINGTMYWYAERKSDGRISCQLLTSTDYGRNWKDHGRFFEEDGKFAFTGIIQFGQNYSDAPSYLGDYLYMFDGGTKAKTNPHYLRTDMLLARIPLDDLLNRRAVEFFDGTPRNPSWTSDIDQARAVFEDRRGVNSHVSCTYNKAIGRYILLTMHSNDGVKKGFGIFESDRPWGPWSTVHYMDKLDEFVPGLAVLINLSLPSKWISPDGKSMWLVFSGRPSDPFYSFNLIKLKLHLTSGQPCRIARASVIRREELGIDRLRRFSLE